MELRRLRGLVGAAVLWSIPWAMAGAALGLFLLSRNGYQYQRLSLWAAGWPAWLGGPVGMLAANAALVGAVNGIAFAGLVMLFARRRQTRDIRWWHFLLIGGAVTALPAVGVLGMPTLLAVPTMMLGALGAVGYLWSAKRGADEIGALPAAALSQGRLEQP